MKDVVPAWERLLAERFGIETASLGAACVERAIAAAMHRMDVQDAAVCLERLSASRQDQENCLEDLVVAETWFFRDREPFVFLKQELRERWFPAHPDRALRILSAPCSTGEEPYSIAISLREPDMPARPFRIDAADISRKALTAAKRAVYGKTSFRHPLTTAQTAFFTDTTEGRRLTDAIAGAVRFHQADLTDPGFLAGHAPYHVVFCRNVLIYLTEAARMRVLANLDRLLAPDGILFTGHSEMGFLQQWGFAAIRHPRAFACRRAEKATASTPAGAPAAAPGGAPVAPSRPSAAPTHPPLTPSAVRPATTPKPNGGIDAFLGRAGALADRGRLEEAAALCRQYLQDHPPQAGVYCLLGLIHEAAGRPAEAEDCYSKALYLDPDHYESLLQASLLYGRQGNAEKASLFRRRAEQRERRTDGRKPT